MKQGVQYADDVSLVNYYAVCLLNYVKNNGRLSEYSRLQVVHSGQFQF